jgi:hypothetical protein
LPRLGSWVRIPSPAPNLTEPFQSVSEPLLNQAASCDSAPKVATNREHAPAFSTISAQDVAGTFAWKVPAQQQLADRRSLDHQSSQVDCGPTVYSPPSIGSDHYTTRQFCTQDYGTSDRLEEALALGRKRLFWTSPAKGPRHRSNTVIGNHHPRPISCISCKHGLSVDEIRIASEAIHYISGLDRSLWYAVVADQYCSEWQIRHLIRQFKSDLARAQKRSGIPACCYIEILEGHPAVHSNILFPLDGPNAKRLIDGLLRSKRYPGDTLVIKKANGDRFLSYCSKERVTQARWVGVGVLAKRLPGSHPLGEGGGDRLRLSKALKEQLLEEGLVRPYRARYAARELHSKQSILAREPDPNLVSGPLPEQAQEPNAPICHERPGSKP